MSPPRPVRWATTGAASAVRPHPPVVSRSPAADLTTIGLDGGRAHVGFTAGQFGGFADVDVPSWSFESGGAIATTPEPGTLARRRRPAA